MMAALLVAALLAPPRGSIPVAFVISEGATMIDFAGPWEVFQDVHVQGRGRTARYMEYEWKPGPSAARE